MGIVSAHYCIHSVAPSLADFSVTVYRPRQTEKPKRRLVWLVPFV